MTINDVIMNEIGNKYSVGMKVLVVDDKMKHKFFSGTLGELSSNMPLCAMTIKDENSPYYINCFNNDKYLIITL